MRKIYLFLITIILFVCICKCNIVKAEVTPLKSINEKADCVVNNVSFSNFVIGKRSFNNEHILLVNATIKNNSNINKKYAYVVNFYDSNRKFLQQERMEAKNLQGRGIEKDRYQYSTPNGDMYVKDVAYYKIGIKVVDVASTPSQNTSQNPSQTTGQATSQPTQQPDTGQEKVGEHNQNSVTEKIPSKLDEYKQYDYVIDKYDVNIIVNEDNSLDVTETIVTFFNVPKHGIMRNIPYVNKIERVDGTSNKVRAKIDNIKVSENSKLSRENNNYIIKIGSEDKTIEGKHVYKIKYKYILGRDKLKGCDELYYNIIGTQWDTVIGNITYKISMPKEFDTSKVGISIGQKGTVGIGDKKGSELKIDGKIISGSYSDVLMPNEGITIRTELPEGYFITKSVMDNKINYLMFTIPIVGLIISFIMWLIYGKDNKVIVTEQHYPPEGYNSAEIGMLYRGRATDEDVVSLLVYLANKGYIKIVEKDKENLFDSDTFKIIKLKPYDGNNEAEALFMEGLFTSRPSIASIRKALKDGELEEENVEEVTASDLRNHFYKYVNRIKEHINRKEVRDDIFEGNTAKKSLMVALMMIASYVSILIIPVIDYMGISELTTVLLPILFFIPFFAVALFVQMPLGFRIMWGGIVTFMMTIFFIAMGIIAAIFSETIFSIGFGIGIVCIIGMGVCYRFMSKRTPFGNEMLGKIKGFKRFLETSSKERLEAMVEDNPSYFYDILPYTYVLGVSNKWIKKFETICATPPTWYYGHDPHFNMHRFGSFMNDTMRSSSSAMSSSPSSSGSGGGGSSGGGAGGGGGSSW